MVRGKHVSSRAVFASNECPCYIRCWNGAARGLERKASATTAGDHLTSRRRGRWLRRNLVAVSRPGHRDLRDLPDARAGCLEPRGSEIGRRAFGHAAGGIRALVRITEGDAQRGTELSRWGFGQD